MAERVGFEPTYRLITDNSISSRARYGLFATFPWNVFVFYMKSGLRASLFSRKKNEGLPQRMKAS